MVKVTKSLLLEANRQFLLNKSRNAQEYKNKSKGRNRYERRTKSSISATTRDYNDINMDLLFKEDNLVVNIPVAGETDVYLVTIDLKGLLKEVEKRVKQNKGKLSFKVIVSSFMQVFNTGDVKVSCTCPDAQYRQNYWQTQNGWKAGEKETRASNITNPNDTLGAGCKHVMLILANLSWVYPLCSVINNYIKYCQENLQRLYADYIFPKVFGITYDKAVQLNLFDDDLLPNDRQTMNAVNQRGRDVKQNIINQKFNKKDVEQSGEEENPLGLKFGGDKNKELAVSDEEETSEEQ